MFFFRASRFIIYIIPSGTTSSSYLPFSLRLFSTGASSLSNTTWSPGRIPTTHDLRPPTFMQASALLSHKLVVLARKRSVVSVAERSTVAFDTMADLVTRSHTSHEFICALCSVIGWPYDNLLLLETPPSNFFTVRSSRRVLYVEKYRQSGLEMICPVFRHKMKFNRNNNLFQPLSWFVHAARISEPSPHLVASG